MPANQGLNFLIGGNLDGLRRSLKDSEAEVKASQRRTLAITEEVVDREARLYTSATDQRIRQIRQESDAFKKRIHAEVEDRRKAQLLVLRLEKATEEEIARVRQAEAAKAHGANQQRAQAQAQLARQVANQEAQAYLSATEQRLRAMRQEAEETKRVILAEVEDRKEAQQLVTRLEQATEAKITAIRRAEVEKRTQELSGQVQKDTSSAQAALLARQGAEVDALTAKYGHLNAVSDAFGLGLGGRIRNIQGLLGELRTSGLAGTEAGIKAVAEAERDLAVATASLHAQIGTLAGVAFGGLVVTVGAAVSEFAKLEKALNRVEAISGATAAEMQRVATTAIALGASTAFNAVEATEGIAELAAAGFELEQALIAIPAVLDAAAADAIEVGRAAEITGATLNGFGLGAEHATRVVDLLAQAARISATSISDMGESFKYASTVAASTSQSIEDVATFLAILGDAGIKGSQGGTVFRSAMTSLLRPADDAGKLLEKLQIALSDTQGKMLPLTQILSQLREKTAQMGETQRNATIATIFGQEALSGVLAVMKKTDSQVAETARQVRDFDGASREMAATMNKGVIASVDEMGGAFSALGVAIGEGYAPAIQGVAKVTGDAAAGLSTMGSEAKNLATFAGASTIALTGVVGGLLAVRGAASLASVAVGLFGVSLKTAFPWLGLVALGVGGVVAAMDSMARAEREAHARKQQAQKDAVTEVTNNRIRKETITSLAAEHDKLAGKTKLSKAEKKRLVEVQSALEKQMPGINAAIQTSADKHHAAAKAAAEETRRVDELTASRIRLARVEGANLQKEAAGAVAEFNRLDADAKRAGRDAGVMDRGMRGYGEGGAGRAAAAGAATAAAAARAAAAAQQRKVDVLARQLIDNTKFQADLDRASKQPKIETSNRPAGDAYDHPDRPGRGSGDKGAASAAANQEFQTEKAIAEESARLAEVTAEQRLAIERARIDATLSLLDHQRAMGVKSERDYLLDVERVRAEEIDMNARAAAERLAVERKAVNDHLAAVKSAVSKGATGRADEEAALTKKLDTIGAQRAAVEEQRITQRGALHQEVTQKVSQFDQKAAEETARVVVEQGQRRQESEAQLAALQAKKLPLLERERASIESTYQAAIRAADAEYARNELAAKAAARAGDEGKKQAAAMREAGEAARAAAKAAAGAKKDLDLTDVAAKNAAAVQSIQGALLSLAVDPSLERFGNTIRDLANKDEDIQRSWALIATAFENAGGGIEGVEAGFGAILQLTNPVTLGLTAMHLVLADVAKGWEAIARAAQIAQDAQTRALRTKGELTGDRSLGYQADVQDIDTEEREKLKALREAFERSNPQARMINDGGFQRTEMIDQALYDAMFEQSENVRKVREDAALQREKALKDYALALDADVAKTWDAADQESGAAQKVADDRIAALAELDKAREDAFNAEAARLEKELGTYNDAVKKLADLDDELNRGERNDRGERISLAAKRELDLAKLRADWNKKNAEYAEREARAVKDRAKILADRDAAIAGVLDEGIAVRAKSEFQDKSERIEAIRAEATAKLEALDLELSKMREQRAEEREAFEDRQAAIQNLAKERLDAIALEHEALMVTAEKAAALLQIEGGRLAIAQEMARLQAGGTPRMDSPAYVKAEAERYGKGFSGLTEKGTGATYSLPKFHEGGEVTGKPGAEVPIMAKVGEHVYTEQQHDKASRWRRIAEDWLNNRHQTVPVSGPAGGVSMGDLNVTIHAAPGEDGRALWRKLRPEMDAYLRRAGMGR